MKGHFSNILCVLTDTHKQDEVIQQAIHIAKSHQANLTVVLALESLPPNANIVMESFSYIDSEQSMTSLAEEWLEKKRQKWSSKYPFETALRIGDPLLDVVRMADEQKIDLLVKLSDDDLLNRIFGSVDVRLLRKCPCAVWILHRGQDRKYKKVVAAVDLNYHYPPHEVPIRKALNMDILRTASQIALLEFAELHIVHAFDAVPDHIVRSGFISVDDDLM